MTLALVRLDDRLVHGQVVVGWGQARDVNLVVLVDDRISCSDWEQDLFRMGIPEGVELHFAAVDEAARAMPSWASSQRRTFVVTGDIDTLVRLVERAPEITQVNIGGVHQKPGRRQRLPYVFLSDDEAARLRGLAERGVEVTAQDVPTARPVPMGELE